MKMLISPHEGDEGERVARTGSGLMARLTGRLRAGLLAPLLAVVVVAAAPAGASAAGGSTVSGTVTVATGVNANHVHALLLDAAGSEVAQSTVTDNSGSTTTGTYTFANVANGTYKVYVIDTRGADDVVPTYYGGATSFSGASTISVGGAYTIPAITLGSGGAITGTVTDAGSGDAATGVVACEVGAPDPGQLAYWGPSVQGTYVDGKLCVAGTVSTGSYSIGGLVPGATYELQYTFGNTTQQWVDSFWVDGTTLTADPGSATTFTPQTGSALTASFTVPTLGSISGVATDPGGAPSTSLSVELVDSAGTVLSPGVTFSSGTYTVAGLLPGGYRVEFLPSSSLIAPQYYPSAATLSSATAVTVTSGTVTPNINVTLTSAATISGTVSAAQGGADVGGLEVDVVDASGNVLTSAFTNANGTYTIGGLPAGTWYLRFDGGHAYNGMYYATEYYGGSSTLAGSAPLVLTAGEALVGVNQALIQQSTILPGAPVVTAGALSGLYDNRVALRFKLIAGTGTAGYLESFRIKLPKNVSWNKANIGRYLVIAHDTYTYAIKAGLLVVTFTTGKKTVSVNIKAGGITVSRGIEAKANVRQIGSERIAVSATDTTGLTTSLSFTVNRPH